MIPFEARTWSPLHSGLTGFARLEDYRPGEGVPPENMAQGVCFLVVSRNDSQHNWESLKLRPNTQGSESFVNVLAAPSRVNPMVSALSPRV